MRRLPLFIGKRARIVRIYWVFGLLAVAAIGCGDDPQRTQPPKIVTDKTASVAFSVQWITPEADQDSHTSAVTKGEISTKKEISNRCTTIGVEFVECRIYDDKNLMLTSREWRCSEGSGKIESIPTGPDRQFVILGLDKDKDIVYHGKTLEGITLKPRETAKIGPINAYPFMPSGVRATSISDYRIDISWTSSNDQGNIAGYQIYNAEESVLMETSLTSFSHQDLNASTQHCYTVSAYDHFDNTSKQSLSLCRQTTNRITDTGQTTSYTDNRGEDSDYDIITPAYTKLDATGEPLEATAKDWAMVRDDITGLVWEVKTNTGGIHQKDRLFTWSGATDTFIAQLNSNKFGGYNDWRLPSRNELYTLFYANAQGPSITTINTAYFPNTYRQIVYWTSSRVFNSADEAWSVSFFSGSTPTAKISGIDEEHFPVRAVRGIPKTIYLKDNDDRTVTDKTTGLIWQQSPPAPSEASELWTWEEALGYCETLAFAGRDDWRLPNIKELSSIVADDNESPAIDTLMFPNTQTGIHHYWSSTTDHHGSNVDCAYRISFTDGWIHVGGPKTMKHYVRCVRGGQ